MPKWKIEPIWKDRECFIIGGGPSLKGFDWNILKSELTIGCNDAFKLGIDVCKVCVFGDGRWFDRYSKELELYKGMIFTNKGNLLNSRIPWLNTLDRKPKGFHTDALGWNGNTGFTAINLALLFGIKTVYLLGFDMKMTGKEHNWHEGRLDKSGAEVYKRFLANSFIISKDWKEKFSNQTIINVTKDSDLEAFPKVDSDLFWKNRERKINETVSISN